MTRVLASLLLIGLAACGPRTTVPVPETPAVPDTAPISIEGAKVEYYEIRGSTSDELRRSMDALRPKDPYDNHNPVDAYTDWYITWNWPGYGTSECDLSAAIVDYQIRVLLPHWEPPAGAAPELVRQWEAYRESLVLHEKGHVDHVVQHYLDVRTAILHATCSTAETRAQNVLDRLRDFDTRYDRETRHGETQGAVFP